MAQSIEEQRLDEILSKVSVEDETGFELDEEQLPFLFRAVHSLAPRWHSFCLQLEVPELDAIERNGTSVDDRLVLALQSWLREGEGSLRQLISAIFRPAGGGNQRLAKQIALNKDIFKFCPIPQAESASTTDVLLDFEDINKAVGSIQEMLEARVASRWYQMGVTLGAPVRELEIIRGMRAPANDSERMMLKAWLDNGDIKTWQWLADSVGHVAGGSYPKLAKNLAKKKTDAVSVILVSATSTSTKSTATAGRVGKLDINKDFSAAKKILQPLDKQELKDLFRELGLFDHTVRKKESSDLDVYAEDLVHMWILGRDEVSNSGVYRGGATWENLRKALEEQNHKGIATKI